MFLPRWRTIVLASVKYDPLALELASDALRGDRAIVEEAVKNSGMALRYASETLRGDRGIVLAAVRQNVETLEATTKSKQGVVSSSRGDEAAAADGQQGGAWTRGGAGGERAQKKASADEAKRASARTDPDWDFEFESDAGTSGVPTVESSALDADAAEDTGAGTPEAWVSGASGFDDASGEDAF